LWETRKILVTISKKPITPPIFSKTGKDKTLRDLEMGPHPGLSPPTLLNTDWPSNKTLLLLELNSVMELY